MNAVTNDEAVKAIITGINSHFEKVVKDGDNQVRHESRTAYRHLKKQLDDERRQRRQDRARIAELERDIQFLYNDRAVRVTGKVD